MFVRSACHEHRHVWMLHACLSFRCLLLCFLLPLQYKDHAHGWQNIPTLRMHAAAAMSTSSIIPEFHQSMAERKPPVPPLHPDSISQHQRHLAPRHPPWTASNHARTATHPAPSAGRAVRTDHEGVVGDGEAQQVAGQEVSCLVPRGALSVVRKHKAEAVNGELEQAWGY